MFLKRTIQGLQIMFMGCPVPSSEKRNWRHHSIEKSQTICHTYCLMTQKNVYPRNMPDWLPAKGTGHPRMFNGNDPRPAYQHANRYPSAAEHNRIACRKTLCKNKCSGCSSSSATSVDKLQTSICHIHSGGLGRVRQKHV